MEIKPETLNAWPQHALAREAAPGRATTEAIDRVSDVTEERQDILDMRSNLKGAGLAIGKVRGLQERASIQPAQPVVTTDDMGSATPSPMKSLTYGILGLERPEHSAEPPDAPYDAGRWIGAAGKIGAILSLLL